MRWTMGFLALALVSFPVHSRQMPPELLFELSGQFEIKEDGGIHKVDANLRVKVPSIDQALTNLISSWRFEPMTEDGVAVNVPVRYSIQLRAVTADRMTTLTINNVWVWEPPVVGSMATGWRMPNYPDRAVERSIEADVVIYYIAHPDGRITDAHVGRVGIVRSPSTRRFSARDFSRYQTAFRRAVERVASGSMDPYPPVDTSEARRFAFNFRLHGGIRESVDGQIVREWIDLPVADWAAAVDEVQHDRARENVSRIKPIGDLAGEFIVVSDRLGWLGEERRPERPESIFLREIERIQPRPRFRSYP